MAKGKKYGLDRVRAIADALDGKILVRTITALNPNFTTNLNSLNAVALDRDPEPFIEGVVVKANPDNVGEVHILEIGADAAVHYFPLSAGDGVALHINRLSNVHIAIGLNGERAHYVAIAEATD